MPLRAAGNVQDPVPRCGPGPEPGGDVTCDPPVDPRDVTDIEGDVTDIEGDVTDIEGDGARNRWNINTHSR